MIVRIAGEGRWRVPDGRSRELLREDFLLARAVHDEREVDYRQQLLAICRYVRQTDSASARARTVRTSRSPRLR